MKLLLEVRRSIGATLLGASEAVSKSTGDARAARRALSLAAALAIGAYTLSGCGGSSSGGTGTSVAPIAQPGWSLSRTYPPLAPKPWTFLVFLNGANNLDSDGVLNVSQMEQVGSSANVNVVVQWKRLNGWSGDTRRYLILKNPGDAAGTASTQLSHNGSVDMGQAQSLQEFVQWGVHAFPAQHYCLVLWDHGAGWRSEKIGATGTRAAATRPLGRGISYDDLTHSHIDTTQIPRAIAVGSGFKWDLLAMDASLMQMAEVDYELRNSAQYIVGSEESPSELGYPYNVFLADLTANPAMDGRAFGIDIAQKTLASYTLNSDATQSVVDTTRLDALAPAVDALGSALLAAPPAAAPQISAARSTAESVNSSDYYGDYRDLADFAHLLVDSGTGLTPVADSRTRTAAQGVKDALAAAVVYNAHGNQHPHMNGLTIFMVPPIRYAAINHEQANAAGPGGGSLLYADLAFTKAAPNWNAFLTGGPP